MPNLAGTSIEGVAKGLYTIHETSKGATPDVILIGTGTELSLAVEAAQDLEKEGHKVRVVSAPCWELFDEQSDSYKESVLPKKVKARVSVEAGTSFGWHKLIGDCGVHVGIDGFGASGPGSAVYEWAGITRANVVKAAHKAVANAKAH